jgi:acyl-CoA thioesterase
MSLINSTVNRVERDETVYNAEQEPQEFLSICQRFEEKMVRQVESQKKKDMIYNYMVKNDIKTERKTDQKEEKVRKTRKDKEGRKYICGACKLGYLSYPALYTHIKTKHNGVTPEGTIRGESGKPKKRGRPKVVLPHSHREKHLRFIKDSWRKTIFPRN